MERILIFEDDFLSQELLIKIFKKDYGIDICESSDEYYGNFTQVKYCAILMDIALKGKKQGLELIKEIKNSHNHSNIPIICLTAHAHATTRKEALDSGADMFFAKPVHNTLLKDALVSLIKNKADGNLQVD